MEEDEEKLDIWTDVFYMSLFHCMGEGEIPA